MIKIGIKHVVRVPLAPLTKLFTVLFNIIKKFRDDCIDIDYASIHEVTTTTNAINWIKLITFATANVI